MRTKTTYQCEFCNTEYNSPEAALNCEAECLKLTAKEYKEYCQLLVEEKEAFAIMSCTNNFDTRKRCDDAVNAVIAFQKKHGITDNR